MRRSVLLAAALISGSVLALAGPAIAPAHAQGTAPSQGEGPIAAPAGDLTSLVEVETLVGAGLSYPWALAFLPNGDILVTEKSGDLRLVEGGTSLRAEPVSGVPEVYFAGQGGLMDIALHPDFDQNRLVYLTFAEGGEDANSTAVARGVYDNGALTNVEVIFSAAPTKDTAVHYGARMAFLPDNTIVLAIGDGFDYREAAQDLDNQMGSMVRMTDEGGVPADNPFADRTGPGRYIYSSGHRNAQGVVYDPSTQTIYAHEHGPRGGDEINRIEAGKNYGWPVVTYGLDYNGAYVSPFTSHPAFPEPILHWTPSIAPAGLAIYEGSQFPDWQGDLLVAGLVPGDLRRVDLPNVGSESGGMGSAGLSGNAVPSQDIILSSEGRIRDARPGPDGAIYVLTDGSSGKLLRLTPAGR